MIRIRYARAYPGTRSIRLDEHHADAIDFAHDHDFYEISVVTSGQIRHEVGGQSKSLPAGSALFIRPHDAHRFDFDGGAAYDFVNIPFTPAAFRAVIAYLDAAERAEALCACPQPPCTTLDGAALAAFERDVRVCAQSPDQDRVLRALLARLFAQHFLGGDASPAEALPPWLAALLAALKHPANLRRGVPGLQDESGFSPAYLSRAFRKYVGETPTAYVNRMRIDYGKYLLKYTNRAVLDIALECGFENLSHFYHLFTRAECTPPAAYRSSFRRQNETDA